MSILSNYITSQVASLRLDFQGKWEGNMQTGAEGWTIITAQLKVFSSACGGGWAFSILKGFLHPMVTGFQILLECDSTLPFTHNNSKSKNHLPALRQSRSLSWTLGLSRSLEGKEQFQATRPRGGMSLSSKEKWKDEDREKKKKIRTFQTP